MTDHHAGRGAAHRAEIDRRVTIMAAKLEHPSTQFLDEERYQRLRAEVRTLYWVTKEREHRPEWQDVITAVLNLLAALERLDPSLRREVEVALPAPRTTPHPTPCPPS
ncbi:hypothetical protein GCM10022243_49680 [Saccharothrix violaceirubra]|uniref:Uncharacterized protein n=1 Tax=Saccharothrix violaceirubra TaxID=413306 RepID=A0A7W7SZ90_9PSEU|nr:hypothetical protein [Saccharothrix violaceirubra]MBB4963688.1 hypothetical protein [Saccharothrix violaceirubra]